MQISVGYSEDSVFTIEPETEAGDRLERWAGGSVFVRLPENAPTPHPDLMALAAILVVHPFVGGSLTFDFAVSRAFSEACAAHLPYTCRFAVEDPVADRETGTVPSLAFSGGVDSTAALAVMPRSTVAVFMDRVAGDGQAMGSLYNKDSALAACRMIAEQGYSVHVIQSNLEFIRRPLGFPIDWSNGVPAVLLADHLSFSSVSWGMVAESAYRVGHQKFVDFSKRENYLVWEPLFRAARLGLGLPVAGVSEVGTSLIELNSHLAGVGQSCIRGPKGKPCLNCAKCFRKILLDAALSGVSVDAELFDRLVRFKGSGEVVLRLPMKHENVYRWFAARLKVSGRSAAWKAFRRRLAGWASVNWSAAWYAPSRELIAEDQRQYVVKEIARYLPAQTAEQLRAFEGWDIRTELESKRMTRAVEGLRVALESQRGRRWERVGSALKFARRSAYRSLKWASGGRVWWRRGR